MEKETDPERWNVAEALVNEKLAERHGRLSYSEVSELRGNL